MQRHPLVKEGFFWFFNSNYFDKQLKQALIRLLLLFIVPFYCLDGGQQRHTAFNNEKSVAESLLVFKKFSLTCPPNRPPFLLQYPPFPVKISSFFNLPLRAPAIRQLIERSSSIAVLKRLPGDSLILPVGFPSTIPSTQRAVSYSPMQQIQLIQRSLTI